MFGIVGIMIVNVETTSNKSVKDWLFVLKKWRKWKRVCVRQGLCEDSVGLLMLS